MPYKNPEDKLAHYQRNKERYDEGRKRWERDNKDKRRASSKAYYEKNRKIV